MNELTILHLITFIAGLVGPMMTSRFLLPHSRSYQPAYLVTIVLILLATVFEVRSFFIAWPLFCLYGLILGALQFIREHQSLRQVGVLMPLVFSVISSVWFFAAMNDLRLLGYNEVWSLYAAIHGAFLGWIFNGCLIRIFRSTGDKRYLYAVYANMVLFLGVAFGIDGSPWMKKVAVVGLTLSVTISAGLYAFGLRHHRRSSRILACAAFIALLTSMAIAMMNEFLPAFPKYTLGIPTMVWSHGLLNTLMAIPCFFFAVYLASNRGESSLPNTVQ